MTLHAANERFNQVVKEAAGKFYSELSFDIFFAPMKIIEVGNASVTIETHAPHLVAEIYGAFIKALLAGGTVREIDEYMVELIEAERPKKIKITFQQYLRN